LLRFAESGLGALAIGDVLHAPFEESDGAPGVANDSTAILDPDHGAIAAPELQLEALNETVTRENTQVSRAIPLVDECTMNATRAKLVVAGVAEELDEGGIDVDDFTIWRGSVETDRRAVEQAAPAFLAYPQ